MIAINRKNTTQEPSSSCISTYLNWNTMVSTLLSGKDYRDRRFFFPDALHDYHYEFYVADAFSFTQVFLYIYYMHFTYETIQYDTIQYRTIRKYLHYASKGKNDVLTQRIRYEDMKMMYRIQCI